jgi:hypothetical protein
MILLIALVVLIAIREPSPGTEEPIETENASPEGIVTVLPSVDFVFEGWQRGEIATEDIAKMLREAHKDAAAHESIGMEDIKAYEGNPCDDLWMTGASDLNQIYAEYPFQQAIPMGDDCFAAIQKLRYEGKTVYAYRVFKLKCPSEDTVSGAVKPAFWQLAGTAYMTEGQTLNDFSSLAVGDPCTELLEICPIAKVALNDVGTFACPILLPEGLLEVTVSIRDVNKVTDFPISQNAEDFCIHGIRLMPYDEAEREKLPDDMRMGTVLHAFMQADYILLPD